MNRMTYSIYRFARQMMTDDELKRAKILAKEADEGNTAAAAVLRQMVYEILHDGKRREVRAAAAAD